MMTISQIFGNGTKDRLRKSTFDSPLPQIQISRDLTPEPGHIFYGGHLFEFWKRIIVNEAGC